MTTSLQVGTKSTASTGSTGSTGSSYQAVSAALFASAIRTPFAAPLSRQHAEAVPAGRADNRLEVPLSEVTLRHLQSAKEIASIAHLRKEIHLVAAGVSDPSFIAREKKETRRALWALSSAAAPSSGRSALFQ